MSDVNIRYTLGLTTCFLSGNNWLIANYSELSEAFWARVDRRGPDECWPWTGSAMTRDRRGRLMVAGRYVGAPRAAWMLHHFTPLSPRTGTVAHTCDNANCVNPAHLVLTTQRENMHDAVRKARKNCWGHQKLTAEQVHAIRAEYLEGGITQRALGKRYGVARNTVSQIVRGKVWKHLLSSEPAALSRQPQRAHLSEQV